MKKKKHNHEDCCKHSCICDKCGCEIDNKKEECNCECHEQEICNCKNKEENEKEGE